MLTEKFGAAGSLRQERTVDNFLRNVHVEMVRALRALDTLEAHCRDAESREDMYNLAARAVWTRNRNRNVSRFFNFCRHNRLPSVALNA